MQGSGCRQIASEGPTVLCSALVAENAQATSSHMADINIFAVHPPDPHKVRNIRSGCTKGSFNKEVVRQRLGVDVDDLLLHQRAGESCGTSVGSPDSGPTVRFDCCLVSV